MPFHEWPATITWLGALLAGLLVFDALRRCRLREGWTRTWLLAGLTVLAGRQMEVMMPEGLSLQYLGSAWLALLLGYPRAVVTMAAIYLVEALAETAPVAGVTLSFVLLGVAPAWLICLFARAARRRLPPNLFVFLIGVGFLGLQLAYALPLLASAGLTVLLGGPAAAQYWTTMLPYGLLLAFGESWLEGFLVTLLVVFAPDTVRLYDERHYLQS